MYLTDHKYTIKNRGESLTISEKDIEMVASLLGITSEELLKATQLYFPEMGINKSALNNTKPCASIRSSKGLQDRLKQLIR